MALHHKITKNLAKIRTKECKREWPCDLFWHPGITMCKFKNVLPVMNVHKSNKQRHSLQQKLLVNFGPHEVSHEPGDGTT